MTENSSRLTVFVFLMLMTFGLLALCYWYWTQWRVRHRVSLLSRTYQPKVTSSSHAFRFLDKLSAYLTTDENEMKQKLVQSGIYNTTQAHLFMPIKYASLVIGQIGLMVAHLWFQWSTTQWLLLASVWLVFAVIVPDLYLASRKKALVRKISSQMPYLLDLMSVCVQTGMTIEASIKYLCIEVEGFDKDLAHMLNRTNERARLIGLEKALEELQLQVPSNEIRSFTMTLNQSLQYGSSVYDVLTTLAADIREVQMLSLEEKIGKLAAKMSIPLILFIMIPIVILIAAPGVMRVMLHV